MFFTILIFVSIATKNSIKRFKFKKIIIFKKKTAAYYQILTKVILIKNNNVQGRIITRTGNFTSNE